jgi:RHS repeat-associated protein
MNAQTLPRGFFQLPGQSLAFYNGSGFNSIRHADWLGSTRLATAPDGTFLGSMAVAPYGEEYAGGGSPGLHFTGQRTLLASDLWDFPARELHPVQGRWISPDPAGLAAVDLTDPQTWNRYAYVRDTPTSLTDPTGLQPDDFCYDLYYAISHAECANLPGGPWGSIYPVIPPFPGGGSGRVAPGPTKRPPISGFPNGETLGLPTGLRIPPPTLGGLLGFPDPTGCEFGPCVSIGNQLTTGNEGRRPQFPFLPAAAIGN